MAGSWNIVGYGDDPIPDDPGIVAAQVDHIKAVAADIAAQVAALPTDGAVDAVPWQSATGAPEQFKQVVKQLPGDLDKLRTRYTKVGEAMATFQAVLANTKAAAQANLTKALAAHNEIQSAQAGVHQMSDFAAQSQHQASVQSAAAPPGSPPVPPQPWTGPDYHAQLSAAQQAFSAAKAAIDGAVRQFHQAAKTAAAAVGAAAQDSIKNDTSFWGSIVHAVEVGAHWVASHVPLQAISGILGKIALVAGVLSFIPVLGQVMDVIGLVALSGMVVCDGITAINNAYEGTFGANDIRALGFDALSVATFGLASWTKGASEVATEAATTASNTSRAADAAAASARAQTAAANASVAARGTRVAQLTTGNFLKVAGARVFGVTGRAETALADSRAALTQAQAAEQAATANAALKAQAAASAATAAQHASHVDLGAKVADRTGTAAGVANTNSTETGNANPAVAMVRATGAEVQHLAAWNDDPSGSAAQSLGSQLQAQPIPVS